MCDKECPKHKSVKCEYDAHPTHDFIIGGKTITHEITHGHYLIDRYYRAPGSSYNEERKQSCEWTE